MLAVLFFIYPKFFLAKKPDAVVFVKQNLKISVEVADTPAAWAKGLMFRNSLAQDSGMLFMFPYESAQSFWMKNTLIPLDIIFISKDKQIIDIKENFQPCPSEQFICPSYTSTAPSMYVLEVNAGFVKKHGIKIGDAVEF